MFHIKLFVIGSVPDIFRCVIPVVLYTQLRRGFFVQVKTQLSYDVFIIILTTCFGLDKGPSSGHKIYI